MPYVAVSGSGSLPAYFAWSSKASCISPLAWLSLDEARVLYLQSGGFDVWFGGEERARKHEIVTRLLRGTNVSVHRGKHEIVTRLLRGTNVSVHRARLMSSSTRVFPVLD